MASQAQRRVARQVERRQRRRRRWLLRGLGVLIILVIGAFAYQSLIKEYPGQAIPTLGNEHIASVDTPHQPYNTRPPTSGPHVPWIARWGLHLQPIPDEIQVHNLEDGGVVLQYRCPDCDDLIAKLTAIVASYPEQVILAPYPQMDTRIALTAWGRIDRFDDFDAPRIVRFIEAYRGIDHHPRK